MELAASRPCESCITELRSASLGYWGPFILKGGSSIEARLNSAGCAAIINGDTTTTSCGKALADYEGCADFTCQAKCPDTYTACLVEASAGVCKAFTAAVKAKCPKNAHECYVLPTDKNGDAVRKRVIRRFCGPV